MKNRTISVYSLSKSHAMTGWRLGWIVADPDTIKAAERVMGAMLFGSPPFIQAAAITALEEAVDTVDRIRDLYKHRRDRVCEAVSSIPKVKIHKPDGGMFLMLDIRETGMDTTEFARKLLDEQKLALLPGDGFGKMLAGHLRLSLGTLDERLEDGDAAAFGIYPEAWMITTRATALRLQRPAMLCSKAQWIRETILARS